MPVSSTEIDPRAIPCLCAQTRRVDRLLNRIYDDALRPLGINTAQKSLLSNIGKFPQGIDFTQLSERLAMDRSTLTRNLTTLESAGYVRVQPGQHDRRKRVVTLTENGRDIVDRSEPLWREAQLEVMNAVGFERAEALSNLLASVERIVRELD